MPKYRFSHWEDGSTDPVRVVDVTSDMTLTAYYEEVTGVQYKLNIIATEGGTTTPPPGTYTYDEGAVVTVTATPDSGYVFDHWELDGENIGSANPTSVVMDADHELKAVFATAPAAPSPPLTGPLGIWTFPIITWLGTLFPSIYEKAQTILTNIKERWKNV